MKKMIFAVMFLVAVAFNAPVCAQTQSSNTQESSRIENGVFIPGKKSSGFGNRPVEATAEDTPTGIKYQYKGEQYEIYLNKNRKAFVVLPKNGGTGNWRKWLGAEGTAQVIDEMNKKKQ